MQNIVVFSGTLVILLYLLTFNNFTDLIYWSILIMVKNITYQIYQNISGLEIGGLSQTTFVNSPLLEVLFDD